MKKVITMLTICAFAFTGKVSAQGAGKASFQDLHFIILKEGLNKMITTGGTETVQLVKKGDAFSEVLFKDATGKTTRLVPAKGVVIGAPTPGTESSASKFRYIYFSNGTDIGMVVRKNDAGSFNITLDLPDLTTAKTKAGKAQNRRVEVKLSY